MELFPEWVLNERRQIFNHLDSRRQKCKMQCYVRLDRNRYAISVGYLSLELGCVHIMAGGKKSVNLLIQISKEFS